MADRIIPFRTIEGCVQIPEGDPGKIVTCRECTDALCRKVQNNVQVLSTSHLSFSDVIYASI